MRLDKYICSCTELTRVMAKRALSKGRVLVNGQVIKSPATKVSESDEVLLDELRLTLIKTRYIMLNKPADFVCSTVDENNPSVLRLLDIEKPQTLHIAGRLDVDTTGLVLITDDGKWSHAITSPNKACGKRYRVELAEPISDDAKQQFADGIQLHGERQLTRPAKLEVLAPYEVLLTINEGKYHQVKRMFAAIGNKVVALHREAIGHIELDGDLEAGQWRYLTEQEAQLAG